MRAVLLRPVATPRVDRLVAVREDLPGIKLRDIEVSPPELFDLAARRDVFASVAGYVTRGAVLPAAEGSTRYTIARTLGDYFGLFRVRPQLGRLYTADESRDGRHMVVVLTDAFWRERFGGDPSAVGRPLRLNTGAYTVVGVLPPEFRYPRDVQFFVPSRVDSSLAGMRGVEIVTALARLRDGITLDQANAALAAEARSWPERYPQAVYARYGVALVAKPFTTFDAGQLRPVVLVMLGAVALVLLVACANVACLQLVRVTGRSRELAVRVAIGAGRGRLAWELLTENLVLAAAGGALGLALGWALTRVFVWLAPADLLALKDLRLDGAVLAATSAAACGAALLAGVVPAVRASRANVRGVLAEGAHGSSAGRGRQRVLRGAVVAQLALSTLLLLGTGVIVRSLARMLDASPGFRAERVVAATVGLPFERYAKTTASNAFYAELLARLRAVPGVEAVGLTNGMLLRRDAVGASSPFRVVGRDTTNGGDVPHANIRFVNGEYFRAMAIPVLRGRTFGPQDEARPDGPGARMSFVVDETLARRYFPGEDPIGRVINQGPDGVIVGVVGAVRDTSLAAPTKATVYYNYPQAWASDYTIVVRSVLRRRGGARDPRRGARARPSAAGLRRGRDARGRASVGRRAAVRRHGARRVRGARPRARGVGPVRGARVRRRAARPRDRHPLRPRRGGARAGRARRRGRGAAGGGRARVRRGPVPGARARARVAALRGGPARPGDDPRGGCGARRGRAGGELAAGAARGARGPGGRAAGGVGGTVPPMSGHQRVHHAEVCEPPKVRVRAVDPVHAVLAHEHDCVEVVQDAAGHGRVRHPERPEHGGVLGPFDEHPEAWSLEQPVDERHASGEREWSGEKTSVAGAGPTRCPTGRPAAGRRAHGARVPR